MKYHVCLFDMDGTVLDTIADLHDAVNHILTRYGYPERSLQYVRDATGNGARNLIACCLPQGEETPDFEEIFAAYKEYYAAHSIIKTAPYAGIPELLRELQEDGCRVAIVSNKPDRTVNILAQRFFPGIPALGERPEIPHKPAPDMVYHALKELGAEKESVAYIGDSEVDVATARNAGVELVAVSWGFRSRERLEEAGAVRIADTVAQLRELLK